MQPVDVQNREDQLLGAAWRRCEAALPEGWNLWVEMYPGRTHCVAAGRPPERYWNEAEVARGGPTPAAALDALTEALANR